MRVPLDCHDIYICYVFTWLLQLTQTGKDRWRNSHVVFSSRLPFVATFWELNHTVLLVAHFCGKWRQTCTNPGWMIKLHPVKGDNPSEKLSIS